MIKRAHTGQPESLIDGSLDTCFHRTCPSVAGSISNDRKRVVEFVEPYEKPVAVVLSLCKREVQNIVANEDSHAKIGNSSSRCKRMIPVLAVDYSLPTLLDNNAQSTITILLESRCYDGMHIVLPAIIVEDMEPLAPLCYRDYGSTNEMFVAMRNGSAHLWSRWAPTGESVVSIDDGDAGAFAHLQIAAEIQHEDDEGFATTDSIYDDTIFEESDSDSESDSEWEEESGSEEESDREDEEDSLCVVFG
jgi:hypothetical protein